jgi:hypothetical protein
VLVEGVGVAMALKGSRVRLGNEYERAVRPPAPRGIRF